MLEYNEQMRCGEKENLKPTGWGSFAFLLNNKNGGKIL